MDLERSQPHEKSEHHKEGGEKEKHAHKETHDHKDRHHVHKNEEERRAELAKQMEKDGLLPHLKLSNDVLSSAGPEPDWNNLGGLGIAKSDGPGLAVRDSSATTGPVDQTQAKNTASEVAQFIKNLGLGDGAKDILKSAGTEPDWNNLGGLGIAKSDGPGLAVRDSSTPTGPADKVAEKQPPLDAKPPKGT